jgi:hypothetical protein
VPHATESKLSLLWRQPVRPLHILPGCDLNPLASDVVFGRKMDRLKRLECQTEQFGVLEGKVVVIGDASGTGFGIKPFSEAVTYCINATAWPGASFKDGYVVTRLC